jgi:hypothetical protein
MPQLCGVGRLQGTGTTVPDATWYHKSRTASTHAHKAVLVYRTATDRRSDESISSDFGINFILKKHVHVVTQSDAGDRRLSKSRG